MSRKSFHKYQVQLLYSKWDGWGKQIWRNLCRQTGNKKHLLRYSKDLWGLGRWVLFFVSSWFRCRFFHFILRRACKACYVSILPFVEFSIRRWTLKPCFSKTGSQALSELVEPTFSSNIHSTGTVKQIFGSGDVRFAAMCSVFRHLTLLVGWDIIA